MASAKAFVRHYVELLNYGFNTGDTAPLAAVSKAECSGCRDYVGAVRDIYSDGGFYQSRGWVELEVRLAGRDDIGLVFGCGARSTPSRFRLSDGSRIRRADSERFDFSLKVEEVDGRWFVIGFYAG